MVHILHDNTLTQDNRDKFTYLAGRYGQRVKFHNVEELCADKIAEMLNLIPAAKNSWLTIGALYRLFIQQILPDLDKVIYLDSDIIVNLDIAELWRVDIADKPFAAVAQADAEMTHFQRFAEDRSFRGVDALDADNYFNSGVLLMNLEYFRKSEELILSGVKWYGQHPQLEYMDQDILNYLFSKSYLRLPVKFNTFVREERRLSRSIRRGIYHYLAGNFGQGLQLDCEDAFNRLWMNYFIRTPWFDADTIGRLYANIQQIHVDLKASMVQLSAAVGGKTRAFVTLAQNLEATRQIFTVRPDEEIISCESPDELPKVVDDMKRGQGQKIFFVLIPNFPSNILTAAGFVPGKDFLNGFDFLSEIHGLPPMNSYPLIKKM